MGGGRGRVGDTCAAVSLPGALGGTGKGNSPGAGSQGGSSPSRRETAPGDTRHLLEPGGVYVQLRIFTFLKELTRKSPQVKNGNRKEEPNEVVHGLGFQLKTCV